MAKTIEETLNAFTTYMHFVKEEDFESMYADLTMALRDSQIDPLEFRLQILEYIQKIVAGVTGSAAEQGFFFNRYCRKLQRTADALGQEFGTGT